MKLLVNPSVLTQDLSTTDALDWMHPVLLVGTRYSLYRTKVDTGVCVYIHVLVLPSTGWIVVRVLCDTLTFLILTSGKCYM